MSRRTLQFALLFIILATLLALSKQIQVPILAALHSSGSAWFDIKDTIAKKYDEHFDQAKSIEELRGTLKEYTESHLTAHQIAVEFNALLLENNSTLFANPSTALVRAISYANFGDFNKLWLEMDEFNNSRIYGLIYGEKSAGIVTSKNSKPLALLNADLKCSYAVYVGDDRAPGIIRGQNSDRMIVEYIPIWIPISVGDEVVTSGLDGLFFDDVKVGKVVDISLSRGYQQAVVEPYYKGNEPKYFHIITKVY